MARRTFADIEIEARKTALTEACGLFCDRCKNGEPVYRIQNTASNYLVYSHPIGHFMGEVCHAPTELRQLLELTESSKVPSTFFSYRG